MLLSERKREQTKLFPLCSLCEVLPNIMRRINGNARDY